MNDPQEFRNDPAAMADRLNDRGHVFDVPKYQALESRRKDIQVATEQLQQRRNELSKSIGQAKARGEDISSVVAEVSALKQQLNDRSAELDVIREEMETLFLNMPNIPDSSVPAGTNEDDNVEQRQWGSPGEYSFTPREHDELGAALAGMDPDAASSMAGSRFVVLSGQIARLHRALAQFMLDQHTEQHGYRETNVPLLVNADAMQGTGQLPKFADDAFITDDQRYLIPTAEVSLTNLVADTILDADQLPIRWTAHTPCFRREAGSYGRDTRGMIRQHQFEKVELVQIVHPDHSFAALEELTGHAESILKALELPYRVMLLCAGDMGFSAAKTYDLEVWLPGQNAYREISSCSNCTDFQARRMQARFRDPDSGKPRLVHTLNGSGLAVGRTLIAVMENYQEADGSIRIPDVLLPYMNGLERIAVA